MNEQEYRAWRVRLRQVSSALTAEALAHGAQSEQIGVMEALFDPARPAESYVTPRHGTVWVSDSQVRAALDWLREAGGRPRLRLIDGLYPPRFTTTLRQLGLAVVQETPLLLLPLPMDPLEGHTTLSARPALGQADRAAWAALAHAAKSPPPGAAGWLLLREGVPVAAARFGAVGSRAARLLHWCATNEEPAEARRLLTAAGNYAALGFDLLFCEAGPPEAPDEWRRLGFRDSGAVLMFEAAS